LKHRTERSRGVEIKTEAEMEATVVTQNEVKHSPACHLIFKVVAGREVSISTPVKRIIFIKQMRFLSRASFGMTASSFYFNDNIIHI